MAAQLVAALMKPLPPHADWSLALSLRTQLGRANAKALAKFSRHYANALVWGCITAISPSVLHKFFGAKATDPLPECFHLLHTDPLAFATCFQDHLDALWAARASDFRMRVQHAVYEVRALDPPYASAAVHRLSDLVSLGYEASGGRFAFVDTLLRHQPLLPLEIALLVVVSGHPYSKTDDILNSRIDCTDNTPLAPVHDAPTTLAYRRTCLAYLQTYSRAACKGAWVDASNHTWLLPHQSTTGNGPFCPSLDSEHSKLLIAIRTALVAIVTAPPEAKDIPSPFTLLWPFLAQHRTTYDAIVQDEHKARLTDSFGLDPRTLPSDVTPDDLHFLALDNPTVTNPTLHAHLPITLSPVAALLRADLCGTLAQLAFAQLDVHPSVQPRLGVLAKAIRHLATVHYAMWSGLYEPHVVGGGV